MKTKLILLLAVLCVVRLTADTLTADTAVFAQSDPKSTVLTRLKRGTVVESAGEAPAGWRRVEVTGPFEAYVHNRDLTKGLEVRPGANIYAAPNKNAQVLTVATATDKAEITGLHGDYCQIKLDKKLQGFIATGDNLNVTTDKPMLPVTAPPVAAPAANVTTLGHPVQLTSNSADTPRMFAGKLVIAKRAIVNPNPLYDYQLMDNNGRRFAYVDTRRLLLTDKIETYLDRNISISGTVRNTVDGKDLVVAAESMQLKQ
jgi:hypothetical protein